MSQKYFEGTRQIINLRAEIGKLSTKTNREASQSQQNKIDISTATATRDMKKGIEKRIWKKIRENRTTKYQML